MKNLKMISAFAILLMALSCNDDDNSEQKLEENGFFSEDVLKVGNKWVYWYYEIDDYFENPEEIIYTGELTQLKSWVMEIITGFHILY